MGEKVNGAKHTVQVEHAKAEQTPKKLTGTRLFEGLVLFLQPSVFSFYVLKLGVGSCPVTSCGIGALGGISDMWNLALSGQPHRDFLQSPNLYHWVSHLSCPPRRTALGGRGKQMWKQELCFTVGAEGIVSWMWFLCLSCFLECLFIAGAMDRPSYLEEDYSSLDGLDDDVFHSDDFGLAGQPGEMTATGIFTQNQSYSCLLGRFQLFPLTHCCGPGVRHPEQQDKATQTLSPSSSSQDVMLPCGVTEEPRRLFYGKSTPMSPAFQQGNCPFSTSPARQFLSLEL